MCLVEWIYAHLIGWSHVQIRVVSEDADSSDSEAEEGF